MSAPPALQVCQSNEYSYVLPTWHKDLYFTFYPARNYTTTLNLAALELETFKMPKSESKGKS